MSTEKGISIAISPVQMAAILHRKTVSEGEAWSNRLWGGLGVIGGVIESLVLEYCALYLKPACRVIDFRCFFSQAFSD
ncbi:hypothetical protein [Atlantibacter sp.]|uniref:hypothetical protein n=1 Tax=Atlantibacter sp. TaxID=1903473 RepID=UPI0028A7E239|nr:hypothetical protein [Atlantibacter sp.]